MLTPAVSAMAKPAWDAFREATPSLLGRADQVIQ
jgi:hypothetical protein